MKLYGFDATYCSQGEIIAAKVDALDLQYFPLDVMASSLSWEYADTTFTRVRRELLARLTAEGADPDLIDSIKQLRASQVPVVIDEGADHA